MTPGSTLFRSATDRLWRRMVGENSGVPDLPAGRLAIVSDRPELAQQLLDDCNLKARNPLVVRAAVDLMTLAARQDVDQAIVHVEGIGGVHKAIDFLVKFRRKYAHIVLVLASEDFRANEGGSERASIGDYSLRLPATRRDVADALAIATAAHLARLPSQLGLAEQNLESCRVTS